MYSTCILHVSCSRSCILAFEGGYTHISVSQLYPDVYPNVFLGYIRIHQDTSGYNVLNVWTAMDRVRAAGSVILWIGK